jgi:hypothetical protein
MADAQISNLTAASALAGTEVFCASDGTQTSKGATAAQLRTWAASYGSDFAPADLYFIVQQAAYSLGNNANLQKIFNASTNGTLTLLAGCYLFEMLLAVTGMDAVNSTNLQVDLLGAGGATLDETLWHANGIDATSITSGGAGRTGTFITASASATSIVTGAAAALIAIEVAGYFRCSAGGTIIPSLKLETASAATVSKGSYFWCQPIGNTSMNYVGAWT